MCLGYKYTHKILRRQLLTKEILAKMPSSCSENYDVLNSMGIPVASPKFQTCGFAPIPSGNQIVCYGKLRKNHKKSIISLSNMVILHVHAGHQGVTLNPPCSTPRRNELVKPMKDSTYGTSTSTCNISSPCRHGSTLGNQIRYTQKQPKMALQWWLLSGYMIP